MPLTRFLDPRFRLVAALIDDPEETPEMRSTARRHAELIATESSFTFDEALAAAGITLAGPAVLECPDPVQSEPGPDTVPPAADEPAGQIQAALQADPSRSDRDVARTCGASPTTVGKLRSALGLGKAVRTVTRRGKAYDMALPAGGQKPEAG